MHKIVEGGSDNIFHLTFYIYNAWPSKLTVNDLWSDKQNQKQKVKGLKANQRTVP